MVNKNTWGKVGYVFENAKQSCSSLCDGIYRKKKTIIEIEN